MLMIGIHQFFTRQNFPNPDSSKFSTVKILHHTVLDIIDDHYICELVIIINKIIIFYCILLTDWNILTMNNKYLVMFSYK